MYERHAWWVIGLLCVGLMSCQAEAPDSSAEAVKVPVTTASEKARELFLEGRDLAEKLRVTDARSFHIRAAEMDPGFALAHLALANTSTTANEFWNSLESAVAHAPEASMGERHLILAADAGARGDLAAQEQHLARLVEAYPEDERVHNVLGQYHFGRQDWTKAVEHYEKATTIAPEYSQPYNQLGYALRSMGDYTRAEQAFRKYIELIPGEPNPYDSYAELLMKLGRFEESIENYEKALQHDPNFIASYIGIGNDRIFMDQGDDARATFQKMTEVARNDAERRQALLWTAASFVHEGRTEEAIEVLQARFEIAEAANDLPTMSGDLVLMGNVLLEAGNTEDAMAAYTAAVDTRDRSEAPQDNKDNFRRNHLFRQARVALVVGDVTVAEELAATYGQQIQAHAIPFEIRQHHRLLGVIAMANSDFQTATNELAQANQQDPVVLLASALAHEAAGDQATAREFCERAAHFNGLHFNYAFVRRPALEMLAES